MLGCLGVGLRARVCASLDASYAAQVRGEGGGSECGGWHGRWLGEGEAMGAG